MLLTMREVILAKIEASYGVDPTPAAATDAVLVEKPSWANEGARMIDRAVVKSTFAPKKSIYAGHLRTVSFDCEVKGSGAAGTAPEIGQLLQACSLAEVISAGVSVTYKPTSSSIKSATIYYHQDGTLRKLLGARGTVSFNLTTGGAVKASFKFTGHDGGFTDVALPTPTYDATVPEPLINVPFTIGAYAAVIESMSFDMGIKVATPANIAATDGFGEVVITGRNVTGSINPEAQLKATKDFEADWLAGTPMALALGSIGATAGNIINISMPAVYYRDIAQGDRDGIRTYDLSFGAVESTGDDEVSIAFT